jgi:hypothetical protein
MLHDVSDFDNRLLNEIIESPEQLAKKQMDYKFSGWLAKRTKKKIAHWGNGEIYRDINKDELLRLHLN